MSLSQSLQQKLLQKLSPQQIQLMKLLQVPTANLEQRIKEELEENPALEMSDEDNDDNFSDELKDEFQSNGEEDYEPDGSDEEYGNIDISEYVNDSDDDVADYRMRDESYSGDSEEPKTVPVRVENSFHDMLADQLGMLSLDDRSMKIAEQIVGSIDDDGYLRRELSSIADDLAFRQNVEAGEAEIEGLIKKIQHFDPPGVCARDLQECLLLQLYRQMGSGKDVSLAIEVLEKFFEEFTKKHYEKIQRSLGLNDEDLKNVINAIIKLNPKPGGNIGEINKAESYIVPDFFILNTNGKLEAGKYKVVAFNNPDCVYGEKEFEVTEPKLLDAEISMIPGDCSGKGIIRLDTVFGGNPVYTYNWGDLPGTNDPKDRLNLKGGLYDLTITDTKGCYAIKQVPLPEDRSWNCPELHRRENDAGAHGVQDRHTRVLGRGDCCAGDLGGHLRHHHHRPDRARFRTDHFVDLPKILIDTEDVPAQREYNIKPGTARSGLYPHVQSRAKT